MKPTKIYNEKTENEEILRNFITQESDPIFILSKIKDGVNPNIQARDGRTALTVCVTSGKTEAVKEVLKAGGDPNVRDSKGWTPFIWAVACMETDSIKVLLQYGADPKIKDATNKSAMDILNFLYQSKKCSQKTKKEIVELMDKQNEVMQVKTRKSATLTVV